MANAIPLADQTMITQRLVVQVAEVIALQQQNQQVVMMAATLAAMMNVVLKDQK